MTVGEFQAWLAGYMHDRAEPDAKLIAAKAAEITHVAPTFQSPPFVPRALVEPFRGVYTGDPPSIHPFTVTSSQIGAGITAKVYG